MNKVVIAYTDYKNPYAYLAKNPTYRLFDDFRAEIDWRPYSETSYTDIDTPVGNTSNFEQNLYHLRLNRYSYVDCRRRGQKIGLTIKAPRRIFDSSIANIGMLYAQRKNVFMEYHNIVFERFWKRDLNIEDPQIIADLLAEAGADISGFETFLEGQGMAELKHIMEDAHEHGVFGVPSFIVGGQLYWGSENLPIIREYFANLTC